MEVENKRAKLGVISRNMHDLRKWTDRKQKSIARSLTLWSADIGFIEARFGTGIVGYFNLFRSVFVVGAMLSYLLLDNLTHFSLKLDELEACNYRIW